MAFPRLFADRSPELLVFVGTSISGLMVGDTSKGLDDECEHDADRERADDDEGQPGEDLYPERMIPAHEKDAEGDAAEKW